LGGCCRKTKIAPVTKILQGRGRDARRTKWGDARFDQKSTSDHRSGTNEGLNREHRSKHHSDEFFT
jgi:hypothetical protein